MRDDDALNVGYEAKPDLLMSQAVAYFGMLYLQYRSLNLLLSNISLNTGIEVDLLKMLVTQSIDINKKRPSDLAAAAAFLTNSDFIIGILAGVKAAQNALNIEVEEAINKAHEAAIVNNPKIAEYYKKYEEKINKISNESISKLLEGFKNLTTGKTSVGQRFLDMPKLPTLMQDNLTTLLIAQTAIDQKDIEAAQKIQAATITVANNAELFTANFSMGLGYLIGKTAAVTVEQISAYLPKQIGLPEGWHSILAGALLAAFKFNASGKADPKTITAMAELFLLPMVIGNKDNYLLTTPALMASYLGSAIALGMQYIAYAPMLATGGVMYGMSIDPSPKGNESQIINWWNASMEEKSAALLGTVYNMATDFDEKYAKVTESWDAVLDRAEVVTNKSDLASMANLDVMSAKGVAATADAELQKKPQSISATLVSWSRAALSGTTALTGVLGKYGFLGAVEVGKAATNIMGTSMQWAAVKSGFIESSIDVSLLNESRVSSKEMWQDMYNNRVPNERLQR